jgi:hypothetical protein
MIKLFSALLALTFTFSSYTASAASWYKVEVVIFSNQDSDALQEEHWPDIKEIPSPANAIALKNSSAEGSAYKRLGGGSLSLHGVKNRLKNSGQYKVMYHAGWMQPVYHTQKPRPIRITGGEILDNGMYELDGHIAIGRGTYLHFRPNLFLSRRLTSDESNTLNAKRSSTDDAINTEAESLITLQTTSNASASTPNTLFPSIPEILTINLDQARRMKSKELHYIDHPLMGILVEIKPVN